MWCVWVCPKSVITKPRRRGRGPELGRSATGNKNIKSDVPIRKYQQWQSGTITSIPGNINNKAVTLATTAAHLTVICITHNYSVSAVHKTLGVYTVKK